MIPSLVFAAPRDVPEANQMLAEYHAATGVPLIVPPAVWDAMKAQGIDLTHVKRNDPLPLR